MDINRTYKIITLGCKTNQYESQAISEQLRRAGFTPAVKDKECSVCVINTCTVTGISERKSRQHIRQAAADCPDAVIMVCGCFSQLKADEAAAIPGVDYVCGSSGKAGLAGTALRLLERGRNGVPLVEVGDIGSEERVEELSITGVERARAYVKIQDGCDGKCSYCIIPTVRGRPRSRTPSEITREIEGLVGFGCREVILTGIELSAYGRDFGGALISLLEELDARRFPCRYRLGSLDPSLLTRDFVSRYAALKSFVPHMHLSIQSGNDEILRLMRRKYNTAMLKSGADTLREAVPHILFTADIIVGFPGEDEGLFEKSLSFLKELRLADIHAFAFSPRQGTEAASMSGRVPGDEVKRRIRRLEEMQRQVRSELLRSLSGTEETVLVERCGRDSLSGTCGNGLSAVVTGEKIGTVKRRELVKVRLTHPADDKMCAELI